MPRDPKQIQAEIDQARNALAGTLDEIAYRTSPKKLKGDAQTAAKEWIASPRGQLVVRVAAGLVALRVTVGVVRKIRNR
ncbi:MAG: DUF3618 domain-containing protein [Geodermatophilaceae bacterium]